MQTRTWFFLKIRSLVDQNKNSARLSSCWMAQTIGLLVHHPQALGALAVWRSGHASALSTTRKGEQVNKWLGEKC